MRFLVYFCAVLVSVITHNHIKTTNITTSNYTHTLNSTPDFDLNFTYIVDVSLGVNIYTNETKRLMPLGTGSFVELISKGVFIDKTLLIHDILAEFNYTVIISPHRWGKTVNLDMLKTFLTIQVHPNGTRILPISGTPNYRLFIEGEYQSKNFNIKLEKPLLIANDKYREDIVNKYLGKYPIIYLSFQGITSTSTKDRATTLGEIIAKAFHEHKYMLEVYDSIIHDPKTPINEKNRVENNKKKFTTNLKNRKDTLRSLRDSIAFLGEELFAHFNKKVLILIDDYEELFDIELARKQAPNSMERNLNDRYILKTIVTRSTPNFHHEYKNIELFLHRQHYSFYGFTTCEMELLYEYYKIPETEQSKVRYWYGGYQTPFEEIFNPWSICNYMNSRQLQAYWNDTRSRHADHLSVIFQSPDFQYVIGSLIGGEVYHITCHSFAGGYAAFFHLSQPLYALCYLYHTGYLTRDILPIDYYNSAERKVSIFTYIIINYEISIRMQAIFASKLPNILDTRSYALLRRTSDMWEQFLLAQETTSYELEKQIETCCKTLNDTRYITERNLYHAVVMITVPLEQFHFIQWKYAEEKTTELQIVLSTGSTGIIIEVKKGRDQHSATNVEHQYSAITLVNQYIVKFQKYLKIHDWREIKFVFFHLITNETVQISSKVHMLDVDEK